jgi:hypothetical protein
MLRFSVIGLKTPLGILCDCDLIDMEKAFSLAEKCKV